MASLLEYKCPNCNGHITFDTASQSFKCEFCGSAFSQEELAAQRAKAEAKAQNEASADMSAEQAEQTGFGEINTEQGTWIGEESGSLGEMSIYSCQSCGAQITTDVNTVASKCPYCDSPIIMTGKVSGLNKPNCVIPFKLDRKAAGEALKKFCKGKVFLPSGFISEHKIKEIKGVYVPFWLFESELQAQISYSATRVRTWSDKNYNYTETSYFDVQRGGFIGYADVPVDASKSMPDDYMDGIEPFNYADMQVFDPAFLTGFLADKYDVEPSEAFPRAEERMKNSTEDAFRRTVTGYDSVTPKSTNVAFGNRRYKYAMLPVWLMNTSYDGKRYLFAVNGQTGRVSGTLPIDKKKVAAMFGAVTAAIAAIAQFIIFGL